MLDELMVCRRLRAVGIILDISLKHHLGERRMDLVRSQLSKAFSQILHEDDYLFFLTDSDPSPEYNIISQGLSKMWNFEPGVTYDGAKIFQYTTELVLSHEAESHEIIYLTDRVSPQKVRKMGNIISLVAERGLECKFGIFDIGSKDPDYKEISHIPAEHGLYLYFMQCNDIGDSISDFLTLEKNGR